MNCPPKSISIPAAVSVLAMLASLIFAINYPAVEGIGDKVRLPVFHGAMTWANLMVFAGLVLAAAIYLKRGGEGDWARVTAMRWVTIGMWLVGSVLGFVAALNTWDFTGSLSPASEVMLADPRLVIQLVISLGGIAVLVAPLLTESRRVRAAIDIIFVVALWVGLGLATSIKGGLHPDSPVLNSDEIIIKLLFFAMVISQLVMAVAASTALANWLRFRSGSRVKTEG